jgi:hypothetical protein
MTVVPQLERNLTEAAARLQRRRFPAHWRPRLVFRRAALALGVAGAVAGSCLLLLAGANTPRDEEVAVTASRASAVPAADVEALEQHFSVFRRDASAADQLPEPMRRAGAEVDPSLTRLVAQVDGVRVHVGVRPADGGSELCQFVTTDGSAGSSGCGALRDATTRSSGAALESTTTLRGGRQAFFALFPDGVDNVQLSLRDGRSLERRPIDNGVLVTVDSGVATVSVTSPAGQESHTLHDDPLDSSD